MRLPLSFLILIWTVDVAAQGLPNVSEGTCKKLTLAAQEMNCQGRECTLDGDVALSCEKLKLWADKVILSLDEQGGFAGARAVGNVMLVEGNRLTTCASLTVGPDKVQTRIEDAVVQVKTGPDKMPGSGIPIGKNQAVFTGDIERKSEKVLAVENATFTLCDCGTANPSWRFQASHIDAKLGDRVTLWWPMFYINPFGLGMVPITPPLLPISLPLKSRAPGLLQPSIEFIQSPWPMIDLPFFIPLGRSYDLTVIPGLRMDWVDKHALTPPSRWGAPRLGGRFRYAPIQGTDGELTASWTYDGKHGAARKAASLREPPGDFRTEPQYDLLNRVALSAAHHTRFTPDLRLDVLASWLSDDYYLSDFETTLAGRTADYMPSRAQLALTWPAFSAQVAADYLMVVNPALTGSRNLSYREYQTPERGPYTRLHLSPVPLLPGLHADADVSFVRYGAWEKGIAPLEVMTGGAAGLSYLNRMGPVSLKARAAFDTLFVDTQTRGSFQTSLVLTTAEAFMTLRRRYATLTHTITPRLTAQAMPWRDGPVLYKDEETPTPPVVPLVDERLRRSQTFYQGRVAVDQTLRDHTQKGLLRQATLTLSQPFDLEGLTLYATRADLSFDLRNGVSGAAYASFYGNSSEMRELGANINVPLGPARIWADYQRWTPRAGRFLRTIYELEAPPTRAIPNLQFIHILAGGASLNILDRVQLSYYTRYFLNVPDEFIPADPTFPGGKDPDFNDKRGFLNHGFSITYTSACGAECWGVTLAGEFNPPNPDQEPITNFDSFMGYLRINTFAPNIGGYTVNTQ